MVKYVAGGLLMASVLGLVVIGKADAQSYLGLVSVAFAGLGVHAAMTSNNGGDGPKPS